MELFNCKNCGFIIENPLIEKEGTIHINCHDCNSEFLISCYETKKFDYSISIIERIPKRSKPLIRKQ